MLSWVQLVVHFKEMAQSLVDESFQCFHYYAGQADGSVVLLIEIYYMGIHAHSPAHM